MSNEFLGASPSFKPFTWMPYPNVSFIGKVVGMAVGRGVLVTVAGVALDGLDGANVAGFRKVAEAMLDQGMV